MVGDIKQSIYRFRLADPGIFMKSIWLIHRQGKARLTALAHPERGPAFQETSGAENR